MIILGKIYVKRYVNLTLLLISMEKEEMIYLFKFYQPLKMF